VIVADASAVFAALVDAGEDGRTARQALAAGGTAPTLLDAEVGSALRRHVLAGHLKDGRAEAALADLADLPLTRAPLPPLLSFAWKLRGSVTFYDALYVSLARLLAQPLLTADAALAKAAQRHCQVIVLG
jgi:predicted nucleic acid-binding protein